MNSIIRIQDADDKGLYRGEWWEGQLECSGRDSARHPCPEADSKLRDENPDLFELDNFCSHGCYFRNCDFIFGFSNLQQLRSWIYKDEWLVNLSNAGYRVVIMEGDVRHGHTQAVIDRTTAKVIKEENLLEFCGVKC